ncbi:hypothetical protein [Actinomadura hibisca]|uniref:hypothetical protein n=1 Tax=Actinomadura hibisca TaxID=68565 RepID=UPI000832B960|nr:hypothetical protein [Actinomadura hibisca]
MPRFTYGGEHAATYVEYIDVERGSTLVAEPGRVYDIAPAAGVTRPGPDGEHVPARLPVPPDDCWKPAPKERQSTKENG